MKKAKMLPKLHGVLSPQRRWTKALIQRAVFEATEQLLRADSDILDMDVNERSITHRLAIYLEPLFPGWNVDCEYNRNHDDPKRLERQKREIQSDDTQATTVYPDIIVHRRKTDENLLVIEMKKTTSSEPDSSDLEKLNGFKDQLGYRYALFIKVKTGGKAAIKKLEWV